MATQEKSEFSSFKGNATPKTHGNEQKNKSQKQLPVDLIRQVRQNSFLNGRKKCLLSSRISNLKLQ